MNERIERLAGKAMAMVVHQIPTHVDFTVGSAAGDGFKGGTVGGEAFNSKSTISLWQSRMEQRATIDVVGRGAKAELAEVCRGELKQRAVKILLVRR